MSKEWNFISAVVYVEDEQPETMEFFEMLNRVLDEHFMQYEIIAVNACRESYSLPKLKE